MTSVEFRLAVIVDLRRETRNEERRRRRRSCPINSKRVKRLRRLIDEARFDVYVVSPGDADVNQGKIDNSYRESRQRVIIVAIAPSVSGSG